MSIYIIECRRGLLPENWRFYCCYCERYHIHGKGEGLRSSHCVTPSSPFYKGSYYLVSEAFDWRARHRIGDLKGLVGWPEKRTVLAKSECHF